MNVFETLTLIAAQLKTDAKELIAYAKEDTLGGYHWDEAQRQFPSGSLWKVEGQILYALVRWLKPEKVAEIGGWAGASASHIATALKANGKGQLYSVDNEVGGMKHGNLLADDLRELVTLVSANGEDWLAEQPDGSIGIVFEDADHSSALVSLLSSLALKKIEPGGLLVNHDAGHDFAYVGGGVKVGSAVGREVRDGLAQANAFFRVYLAEPSDCGLAITVIPGARNLDKHSTKVTEADANPELTAADYKAMLSQLSPDEFRRLHQNQWPQGSKTDASPLSEYAGNAHIESASVPPPVQVSEIHPAGSQGDAEPLAKEETLETPAPTAKVDTPPKADEKPKTETPKPKNTPKAKTAK